MHDREAETLPLTRLITQVQALLRRRAAASAALWAVAAVLAGMAALLAADAAWNWRGARPLVYGGTLAGGVAAIALAVLAAWRPMPSAFYVARLIETRRPELKNSLITFVELAGDTAADPSMSVAVGRRVVQILSRVEPVEFLPPPVLRRPATAAALAAVFLAAGLWLAQGVLFAPWAVAAQAGPVFKGQASTLAAGGVVSVAAIRPGDNARPAGAGPEAAAPESAPKAGEEGSEGNRSATGAKAGSSAGSGGQAVASDGNGGPGTAGMPSGGGQGRKAPGQDAGAMPSGAQPQTGHGGDPTGNAAAAGDPDGSPGTPATDAGGGAKPGTGTGGTGLAKPRQPYTGPAPLPRRPQPAEFSTQALDAMRKVRRLIDQETRPGGEKTDVYLGKMGAGNAEPERYSAAWQRPPEVAAPATAAAGTGTTTAKTPPAGELIPAARGTESRPYVGGTENLPDGRRDCVQGDDVRVSPRLRPAVAAYFETVSRLAAEKPAKNKP
jgi:hypothetical protein